MRQERSVHKAAQGWLKKATGFFALESFTGIPIPLKVSAFSTGESLTLSKSVPSQHMPQARQSCSPFVTPHLSVERGFNASPYLPMRTDKSLRDGSASYRDSLYLPTMSHESIPNLEVIEAERID